jgi:hypothetical protein
VSAAAVVPPYARHSARRGARWLLDAWVMLSAARVPWWQLFMLYYLIDIVAYVVPVAGPIVVVALRPVFTVGILAAAWSQERGGKPEIQHLFRGFAANLWALIPIGAFVFLGDTLAVASTMLVDGGELLEAIAADNLEQAVAGSRVELAMLLATACAVPVVLAAWFAPALVVFNGCGTVQALASSLRAALANWRPAIVYFLLLFIVGGLAPLIALKLIALALPPELGSVFARLAFLAYVFLVFVPVMAISDYVTYRDIFHADERPAPTDAPGANAPA